MKKQFIWIVAIWLTLLSCENVREKQLENDLANATVKIDSLTKELEIAKGTIEKLKSESERQAAASLSEKFK